MKKITSSIWIVAAIIIFVSCNGNSSEDKSVTDSLSINTINDSVSINKNSTKKDVAFVTEDCAGGGNYYIREGEADTLIKNFKTIFSPYSNWQPVFIDGKTLLALANTLEKVDTLDGVRFASAVSVGTSTTFAMIPTTKTNLCEGNTEYTCHKNVYGRVFPDPPPPYEFVNFNRDKADITKMTEKFINRFIKEGVNLSKSMWIDKCVFADIKKKLESEEIDGVLIYFAAYITKTVPSQKYDNQSTLVIVPTLGMDGKFHKKNMAVIQNDKNFKANKAYNHGELCPNYCGGQ